MIKKFLLADDDPDDADFFREALDEIDDSISCIWAKSGADLVRKIQSNKLEQPEIIFLDINMPEMDGWETLMFLKNSPMLQNVPVVMYSTSSARKDTQKALELGALCFYEKPTNYVLLKEFLALVTTASLLNKEVLLEWMKSNKAHKLFV
jgi:CheY-like chemotaxis protein